MYSWKGTTLQESARFIPREESAQRFGLGLHQVPSPWHFREGAVLFSNDLNIHDINFVLLWAHTYQERPLLNAWMYQQPVMCAVQLSLFYLSGLCHCFHCSLLILVRKSKRYRWALIKTSFQKCSYSLLNCWFKGHGHKESGTSAAFNSLSQAICSLIFMR